MITSIKARKQDRNEISHISTLTEQIIKPCSEICAILCMVVISSDLITTSPIEIVLILVFTVFYKNVPLWQYIPKLHELLKAPKYPQEPWSSLYIRCG